MIPPFGRLRQEDHMFQNSLAYIVSPKPACVSILEIREPEWQDSTNKRGGNE